MKLISTKLFIVLLSACCVCSLVAGDNTDKKLAKVIEDQGIFVETAQTGITMSGFVDAGFTYDMSGAGTLNSNRAVNGNNPITGRIPQDSQPKGDFNLNAFKLVLEKALPEANDFAAGFRVDLVYGEDANFYIPESNGATGLSSDFTLGLAYVTFRVPVGNGLDFQLGHVPAFLGYEAPERAANINITHSFINATLQDGPGLGLNAIYPICDAVTLKGGVRNDYVSGSDGAFTVGNTTDDQYVITGAIQVDSPNKNATVQSAFTFGPSGGNIPMVLQAGQVRDNEPLFVYTLAGNWKPVFAKDKLLLGFDINTGFYDNFVNANALPGDRGRTETWRAISLYSKYQFTEIYSLAGRFSYAGNTANAVFNTADPDNKGNDLYSYTITSGFDIWENMVLRAEYRVDWANDYAGTLAGERSKWGAAHLIATQVVYSF